MGKRKRGLTETAVGAAEDSETVDMSIAEMDYCSEFARSAALVGLPDRMLQVENTLRRDGFINGGGQ